MATDESSAAGRYVTLENYLRVAASATLSWLPERSTGLVVTGVKPRRDDPDGYSYYSRK